MELKYAMVKDCILRKERSNCTFMELKYRYAHLLQWRLGVLIVPLWN